MSLLDPQAGNISLPNRPQVLVSSSIIQGYSYDAQNYVLDVWYKGKTPKLYRYYIVYPGIVSQIFDSAGSIGSKASKNLKGLRSIKLL